MQQINFENLPSAVSTLLEKVMNLERLLLSNSSRAEQALSKSPLLTVSQAADFLKLAVPTIYAMVNKGKIPYMKRSKRLYFSEIELTDWIKEGRRRTVSELEEEALEKLIKAPRKARKP